MTWEYTHLHLLTYAVYSIMAELSAALTAQLRLTCCCWGKKKSLFSPFVSWPLNLNECCEHSQIQPLPLRRSVSKNKTTPRPLTEKRQNYSVWPLLKYLMIFTSRQKCPGVTELPPRTFIGVTAASPTTSHREPRQATIVCSVGPLRIRGLGSKTGAVSQC